MFYWIQLDVNIQMMMMAIFLAVAAAAPQFLEQQVPQTFVEPRKPVLITKRTQEHDTYQQKYSYRLPSTIILPCMSTLPVNSYR